MQSYQTPYKIAGKNWKDILDISYTYKGRLARDFGGIFEYFWEKIELIVANPIELCQTTPIVNKKQIKGKTNFVLDGNKT